MIRPRHNISCVFFLVHSLVVFSKRVEAFPNVLSGGQKGRISLPKSRQERDRQAAAAIQQALRNPKTPSFPLIECEFPVLSQLNKLGDGSRKSALAVEEANVEFLRQLVPSLAAFPPFPFLGPKVSILLSSSCTKAMRQVIQKTFNNLDIYDTSQGAPSVGPKDVCIIILPSDSKDYNVARQLAEYGVKVVLVNGIAKDSKSISDAATMAFFFKALTYNSQIAGFLWRAFPGDWTVCDVDGQVLETYKDECILVSGTNTPDLRGSVKIVQKSADLRAIAIRNGVR